MAEEQRKWEDVPRRFAGGRCDEGVGVKRSYEG